MARDLAICPVGRDWASHLQWPRGARSFDLFLVNYADIPGRYREDADHYAEGNGFKLELLADAIERNRDVVDRYDAIWLPDDDLAISVEHANLLFRRFRELGLVMGQPALVGANVNHASTRRDPRFLYRFVTFVEMMCPIFTREALDQVLDTFRLSRSGWGVDCVWARRFRERPVAILDEIPVRHLKPCSGDNPYYRKLRAEGFDAAEELRRVVYEHVTPGRFLREDVDIVDHLKREGVLNVHERRIGRRQSVGGFLMGMLGLRPPRLVRFRDAQGRLKVGESAPPARDRPKRGRPGAPAARSGRNGERAPPTGRRCAGADPGGRPEGARRASAADRGPARGRRFWRCYTWWKAVNAGFAASDEGGKREQAGAAAAATLDRRWRRGDARTAAADPRRLGLAGMGRRRPMPARPRRRGSAAAVRASPRRHRRSSVAAAAAPACSRFPPSSEAAKPALTAFHHV